MSNKKYACPVCAASMIDTCRLCGYSDKKSMTLYFYSTLNTITESIYFCKEETVMQKESKEQKSKEHVPRDYNLNFVDPHGDICKKMIENENK